ncbi:MAG: hypothetical protein JXQ99_04795 [Hyphomicrobiaceae bacterium]
MTDGGRRNRRIVVGLKAAADIDRSVEAATTLAAAIQAEVVGLYVEEDGLLSLAALPFARVIGHGEGRSERLTEAAMAKAIARGAVTSRKVLSAHAEKASVNWSFTVEQGELASKMRGVLAAGDFLVLSSNHRGFGTEDLLNELRSAPRRLHGVVLAVSGKAKRPTGPVIAIDDGDAAGRGTVTLASHIASVLGVPLCLFTVASSNSEADRIVARARSLAKATQKIETHRLPIGASQMIASAIAKFQPSFVVADQEGEPFGDDAAARALLRTVGAPVLLLRSNGEEPPAPE